MVKKKLTTTLKVATMYSRFFKLINKNSNCIVVSWRLKTNVGIVKTVQTDERQLLKKTKLKKKVSKNYVKILRCLKYKMFEYSYENKCQLIISSKRFLMLFEIFDTLIYSFI